MSRRGFKMGSFKALAVAAAFVAGTTSTPARAEHPITTVQTVIDRVQIEDMLNEYYSHIDHDDTDFRQYFVSDGVLDINGIVAKGDTEIESIYKRTYSESTTGTGGKDHLLISNPRIVVDGNSARVDLIYTIVANTDLQGDPRIIEEGREHDELVKQGQRWYLKSRTITSDSGLRGIFVAPYKKR